MITDYASRLKEEIENRRPDALGNAKVVFRPDSGDPVDIPDRRSDRGRRPGSGHPAAHLLKSRAGGRAYARRAGRVLNSSPTAMAGVRAQNARRRPAEGRRMPLEVFGGSLPPKGLPHAQPRGADLRRFDHAAARPGHPPAGGKGFTSSNVVPGIGSYTYQYLTRDSFGWAMKATWAWSGRGPRTVRRSGNRFGDQALGPRPAAGWKGARTIPPLDRQSPQQTAGGEPLPVFRNGNLLVDASLAEIRERLMASWVP